MRLPDRIDSSSTAFLDGLGAELRARAASPFDETERRTWAYWPTARRGVPLSALDRRQAKASYRLLAELLTPPAFARALAIIALEEVLDRLEGYRDERRHIGDYWLTIFGEPGPQPWGLRFEGHHVSVHVTVVAGEVHLTPLFLGANPAVVRDGRRVVSAPLAPEEKIGFELLHALSVGQRSAAVFAEAAPGDILTRNQPRVRDRLDDVGVPLAVLEGVAGALANELVEMYLGRIPDGASRPKPVDLRFGWAGAAEPGIGHYYRLAGPHLLIEFDNTQSQANHIHTVVRDPGADFGSDVLAKHYGRSHQ